MTAVTGYGASRRFWLLRSRQWSWRCAPSWAASQPSRAALQPSLVMALRAVLSCCAAVNGHGAARRLGLLRSRQWSSEITRHPASCILHLASLLLLISLPLAAQVQPAARTEVIILHLNDMHAKTEGFAKIKYLADSLKRTHPWVFIVSAGDNFTGNPYVDMVADKGAPMIDLMNKSGFCLSCIGNHEFDLGQEFLQKRIEQARFPFICANMNTGSTVLKQPKPFFILKAGKLEIPVLGLIEINDNGIPDTHPDKVKGITFTEPLQSASKYLDLKEKYGSLIALTHLGLNGDEKLALRFPQIDVVIGGHSHTILKKPVLENGVLVTQDGSYQRFIGKLTLVFTGNHIVEKSDTMITVDAIRGSDTEIRSLVSSYQNNPEFEKTAGFAIKEIKGKQALGALMSDAVAWAAKADFAFQNRGGIRVSRLPEGKITIGDIYRLDPFGNQVVVFNMNLEQIQSLILASYRKERDIDLIPSGMTYTITKGESHKHPQVKILSADGKEPDQAKIFTVATNAYVAAAYDFGQTGPGKTLDFTTAECIIRYIQMKNYVKYRDIERAKLKGEKKKKQ